MKNFLDYLSCISLRALMVHIMYFINDCLINNDEDISNNDELLI